MLHIAVDVATLFTAYCNGSGLLFVEKRNESCDTNIYEKIEL